MNPQEQQLVDELFDRLAQLESNARDPDAERVIAGGVRRAPHATYALVQTALVMDEALKRANARIEELQAQVGDQPPQQQGGSFLDSMRDAVLGRRDPRGSVPSVRASGAPPAYEEPPYRSQTAYPPQMPPPFPMGPGMGAGMGPGMGPGYGPPFGGGGSFLGSAASTAAGVVGGGLLLDSIRSMFGHHAGVGGRSAFGDASTAGSSSDSSLAHAAGIDSIGHGAQSNQALAEQDRRDDLEADQQDQALADQDQRDDWEADQSDSDFDDDGDDNA
jgi:uncharacterized protein